MLLLTTACAGAAERDAEPRPVAVPDGVPESVLPAAPWSGQRLPGGSVPPVVIAEWRAAENRAECAPLAPAGPLTPSGAAPRAAYFGGGWAVAWDLPGLRSAFGVAGTGASAAGPAYSEWPKHMDWLDGSSAGYGPEGGSGPRQLAYLRIPGQSCLYNVWSNISQAHLEQLLTQLRFVDTGR